MSIYPDVIAYVEEIPVYFEEEEGVGEELSFSEFEGLSEYSDEHDHDISDYETDSTGNLSDPGEEYVH